MKTTKQKLIIATNYIKQIERDESTYIDPSIRIYINTLLYNIDRLKERITRIDQIIAIYKGNQTKASSTEASTK